MLPEAIKPRGPEAQFRDRALRYEYKALRDGGMLVVHVVSCWTTILYAV